MMNVLMDILTWQIVSWLILPNGIYAALIACGVAFIATRVMRWAIRFIGIIVMVLTILVLCTIFLLFI